MTLELNTRMNNDIRAAIKAKAFITSGLGEAKKALIDKRAAFAEEVRKSIMTFHGVNDADLSAKYAEIGKFDAENSDDTGLGLFIVVSARKDVSGYFDVAINGMQKRLHINGSNNGETTHITFTAENRPWIPFHRVLLANDVLADAMVALDNETAAIKDKEKTLNVTMDAVLQNARTIKQLLTAWPEAKELLPESMQKATGTALAINPAELNALCGIPSPK